MSKIVPKYSHQLVRDLLERGTQIPTGDSQTRAREHVQRTLVELELMGFFQHWEDFGEEGRVEYDKFQSRVC